MSRHFNHTIFDRSPISNYIYCKIYWPSSAYRYYEKIFEIPKDILIIILLPSLEILKNRLESHSDHKMNFNIITKLYNEYKSIVPILLKHNYHVKLIEKKDISISDIGLN